MLAYLLVFYLCKSSLNDLIFEISWVQLHHPHIEDIIPQCMLYLSSSYRLSDSSVRFSELGCVIYLLAGLGNPAVPCCYIVTSCDFLLWFSTAERLSFFDEG